MGQKDERAKAEADALEPSTPEEEAFVKGLVARGEAVKLAPGAVLPPDATHEIVGETTSGVPIVKRRRFSAF
jgi:hypothetical protein